jgi:hypothetical protein
VIGELTFSKPPGFLEKGTDVDGIIAALEHMLDYSGKVRSTMPVSKRNLTEDSIDWSNAMA